MTQDTAASSKARRRADLARVGNYYEARLAELLERIREGFARFDAGELSAFDLDDLIHRYKRAARELWKFCGSVTGSRAGLIARTLEEMQSQGEVVDWWERGNPSRND